MIEGKRSLIAQALANLVDNAIKYTPPGGRVAICASARASPAWICRSPTAGPAFPPADRPRVVERFVRLEASRNSPGTGLGLSLVAAVAHFHNAQLLLEDNAPGLKAILRFPRPVRLRLPHRCRAAASSAANPCSHRRRRIDSSNSSSACPICTSRPCRSIPRARPRTLEALAERGFRAGRECASAAGRRVRQQPLSGRLAHARAGNTDALFRSRAGCRA